MKIEAIELSNDQVEGYIKALELMYKYPYLNFTVNSEVGLDSLLPQKSKEDLMVDYIIKTIETKFKIKDYDLGRYVPFVLTKNQKELISGIVNHDFNMVKQSRQTGITTIVCATIAVMVSIGEWKEVCLHGSRMDQSQHKLNLIKEFLGQLGVEINKVECNNRKQFINGKINIKCVSSDYHSLLNIRKCDFLFADNFDFLHNNEIFAKEYKYRTKRALLTINNNTDNFTDRLFKTDNNINKIICMWHNDFRFDNEWYLNMVKNLGYNLEDIQREIDVDGSVNFSHETHTRCNDYSIPVGTCYIYHTK